MSFYAKNLTSPESLQCADHVGVLNSFGLKCHLFHCRTERLKSNLVLPTRALMVMSTVRCFQADPRALSLSYEIDTNWLRFMIEMIVIVSDQPKNITMKQRMPAGNWKTDRATQLSYVFTVIPSNWKPFSLQHMKRLSCCFSLTW
jgi:hypothetical protein